MNTLLTKQLFKPAKKARLHPFDAVFWYKNGCSRRIYCLNSYGKNSKITVKGRENQIAHPIYLPPLLTSEAKTVGGNQDVILKIPGIEGFQMKVKANSVTFPDGSRIGTLVVSPVTADKLPMAPPAGGAQFGVPAWTVQPAGTRFDPPIEVTLPNASSQPPGDNLPIVQWDHDLGQYVPMGRATVSEDGSVLITDSGSGITKAGWGGLCRYDPDKCATVACKFCEKKNDDPNGSCCIFDDSKDQLFHLANNIALSTEPFKNGIDKFTKIVNSAGEFSVKLEGAIVGRRDLICCSIKQKESAKFKLSGAIKLEVQGKFNLIQLIDKVMKFLPRDLKDATDAGLHLLVRGAGTASGSLSYDNCKSTAGDDSVGGIISINGALSARIKWPSFKIKEVEVLPSAELNLGEVGITGYRQFIDIKMKSEGIASGETRDNLYSYFKGDMTYGTLKITNFDFQFPLITPTSATIEIPIADF